MPENRRKRIKELLSEKPFVSLSELEAMFPDVTSMTLRRDINLLEEDLIDSLDYTELLVSIEEEFGIVMSPSEFTRDQMDTPAKIIAQVKARNMMSTEM